MTYGISYKNVIEMVGGGRMEREIDAGGFCEGCIYSDGESCMKITAPETRYNEKGELEFCSGLTY